MNQKIFHISTSLKGGAGIAALNLHSTLLRDGFDSTILTLDPVVENNLIGHVEIKRSTIENIKGKILTFLQSRLNNYTFISTFSCSAKGLLNFLLATTGESKVLHIHNWYNFLDIKWLNLLEENGFEIVFTLHDQRLFTGGCHYAGTCRQFESECIACPLIPNILRYPVLKCQEKTHKSLAELDRFKVITPSEWLMNEARKSRILRTSNISVIQNIFPEVKYQVALNEKGFDLGKIIYIGIASMEPFATIKGGEFLQSLIANPGVCKLIFLRDYRAKIEEFWNTTHILLVPSIQDNSPNVIHEAKQHGVPVIGARVGGIPELLSETYDLLLESPITLSEFNKLMPDYLEKLRRISDLKHLITSEYNERSKTTHKQFLNFFKL